LSRFRWNRTLVVAAIGALHLAAWGGALPQRAYADAMLKVGRYCINDICLGMTMRQAKAVGVLQFGESAPPLSGVIECSGFQVPAKGYLTKPDGSGYAVNFDVVETTGSPESRYRLSSVNKFIPGITQLQLDYLTNSLVARFGGMKQMENSGSWFRQDGDVTVSILTGGMGRPDIQPFVWVTSVFNRRKEWLMSLDACKANLPKL
jgi:hypothetical protein